MHNEKNLAPVKVKSEVIYAVEKPKIEVKTPTPIIIYKELNIYSNSTVSTKCCQFSLLENIFEKKYKCWH